MEGWKSHLALLIVVKKGGILMLLLLQEWHIIYRFQFSLTCLHLRGSSCPPWGGPKYVGSIQ